MNYLKGNGIARLEIEGIKEGDTIQFITHDNDYIETDDIRCILPQDKLIQRLYVTRGIYIVGIFGTVEVGLFYTMNCNDYIVENTMKKILRDAIVCDANLTDLQVRL